MKPYKKLIERILSEGEERLDRTGTGTLQVFGASETYDLTEGKIPLITMRKLGIWFMIKELLWFMRGTGNCDYLDEQGVKIWKPWTDPETNSIGPLYPVQLRAWPEVRATLHEDRDDTPEDTILFESQDENLVVYERKHDQLANLIKGLKEKPFSRRHVISYWNVPCMPDESMSPIENVKAGRAALAACHVLLQFNVSKNKELSCILYMRSSDVMVGRPTNIAQYSILTHMIAQVCGYKAKSFTIMSGDTHIYLNHVDQAKELITRTCFESPRLILNREIKNIDDFELDDFLLINYQHGAPMKLPVAV
jgi:thymidylate synthase|nr:MAG TPA: Thymidylate synthase [Caudoviricetes sp.]